MRSTAQRSMQKDARQASGFAALYVVAPVNPLPLPPGKNRPLSPIRFGVTQHPRDIWQVAAQWNWEEVALVAVVWTRSRPAAELLRGKLESLMLDDDILIRGSWYDMDVPDLIRLAEFAADLTNVETFDDAERQERLQVAIAETLRGHRQGLGNFA